MILSPDTPSIRPSSPRRPAGAIPSARTRWGGDVLSQLLFSTRSEFVLGITAALVTVGIATVVGAASAYYGGILDAFFMRLADLIIALPAISLLIVLSALFNLNLFYLALIIGVLGGFGGTAIVLKSQALTIRVKPFIEAGGRCGGRSHPHHIPAHRPAPFAPLPSLHDVHGHQRHLRRGGALLPGTTGPENELGDHDPHRQHRRVPSGRDQVLVADHPCRRVHHPDLQRLLPGRTSPRRGGKPEVEAQL